MFVAVLVPMFRVPAVAVSILRRRDLEKTQNICNRLDTSNV